VANLQGQTPNPQKTLTFSAFLKRFLNGKFLWQLIHSRDQQQLSSQSKFLLNNNFSNHLQG